LSEEERRVSLEDIETRIRLRSIAERETEKRILRLVFWLAFGALLLMLLYVITVVP